MVTSAVKKAAPVARKSTTAAAKPAAKPAAVPPPKPSEPMPPQAAPASPNPAAAEQFVVPQDDYALIAKLKEKAQAAGIQVKKSALLRAGLQMLDKSSALQLKRVISGLTPIKTGRPKKH